MELGVKKAAAMANADQQLTKEERDLVTEVYARLESFEQENREYHDAARTARMILRAQDPEQGFGSDGKKILQLQTLKSTVNNVIADQMQNMPEARILPETPDKEALAEDLQDAVRYVVYEVNNYEDVHRRRAEDLYATGTSLLQVAWNPDMCGGKGDAMIIRWPIEAFLWDPMAENIQDARALIKVSWHPLSWYAEHYPDSATYVADENAQYRAVGRPDSQTALRSNDEESAMLLEYWYRRYDSKKRKYTINVAYCAGGALLEHAENVYEHGMYPFILDVHSTIEGQPVGDGLVTELAPMMRYINRYAHYIDINLRMSSKARLLTRRNSGIDQDAMADWSKDIIEGDSIRQGEDWAWMQHAPFPASAMQQMLQMQNDLKQDSGANQFTRGETAGGVIAGKAIAALQEAGGKITGLRTDTLNSGFKKMVEQILWLMSEFYTKDRMVMITGRSGERKPVEMSAKRFFGHTKGAIPAPPYMVQVEVNKRNPLRVEAQNEMFMQAYTMAAQAQQFFPLSSLFQMLNIDGKDRLMPVIRANEKWQEQQQQLMQQLEETQMQLEQAQQENSNLRLSGTQMANTLNRIGSERGGRVPNGMPYKVTQGGEFPDSISAAASDAQASMLGGL